MAPEPETPQHPDDEIVSVRVRRAPKYGVFLVLGGALGILAAAILSLTFDGTALPSENTTVVYSTMQVFGFLCLVCAPVGVRSSTSEVRADHARIHTAD